jgi:alkylhydroperoxidase family enzyme
VDFAQTLTARPWTVGPTDIQRLSATGLSRPSIALVIGLAAMFNYFTRVADGTGIEADYDTELPEFVYRGRTEAVQRPEPAEWPPVDRSLDLLSLLPALQEAWGRWREYIVEGPSPIAEVRAQLRTIAARNACDGAVDVADKSYSAHGSGSVPGPADALTPFAEKLSLTPWLVGPSDVDALRATGMDDFAILHAIAVVAHQSAESRLRIGLSALARADI